MADGILKSAVQILEKKHLPPQDSTQVHVPEDAYKHLFDILDVWDSDRDDTDIQTKTKFISDVLGENPRDRLVGIFTEIGVTPPGETKVERVYKYLKLRTQADKILNHYEQVQREIHGLRTR